MPNSLKCKIKHLRHNGTLTERECDRILKALEQEPDTWSLEDVREDFMHDVYNTLDFLPTNDEANQIIDSFDRVTSSIRRDPCEDAISRQAVLDLVNADWKYEGLETDVASLPPVTPKYTDEEIDRAQAVEQAYIDKMVELAVEELKRPKGEWISKPLVYGVTYCSECDFELKINNTNYCPNCGAKMLQEEDPDY